MIKCPKCGSEHVSIVTKIESEQTRSRFFEIILNIAILVVIIGFMALIAVLNNRNIDFNDLLLIQTIKEISSSLIIAYIIFKIEIIATITAIASGIIIMLMPYETHSIDKCICHQCEHEWEYISKEIKYE